MVQSFEIWYVASPSGPCQDCSYDAPGGRNWPSPGGHKFEISEQKRKTLKILFSETTRCRALIFGM